MQNFTLVVTTLFNNVFHLLNVVRVPGFDFTFFQLFLAIAGFNVILIFLRVLIGIGGKGTDHSDRERRAFQLRKG